MAVPEPGDLYTEPARQPTALGDMEIIIVVPKPGSGGQAAVRFGLQVEMSDGSTIQRAGNLWPHLTDQQRTQLMNFTQAIYLMAQGKVLPAP